MVLKEELTKLLMETYNRGVNDAKQAAIETLAVAIDAALRVEREACAQMCDEFGLSHAAEAIRHRGKA